MDNTETIDFSDLQLPISPVIYTCSKEEQALAYKYLRGLNDTERKAYEIAFAHLKTSFNVLRSNGYKEWRKSNSKPDTL